MYRRSLKASAKRAGNHLSLNSNTRPGGPRCWAASYVNGLKIVFLPQICRKMYQKIQKILQVLGAIVASAQVLMLPLMVSNTKKM